MAGSSSASQRAAAAGPACQACRRGRCGGGLGLRGGRLTLTAGKRIPNSRRICSRTIARAYGGESEPQLPRISFHDQGVQAARLAPFSFGSLPGTGLAVNACEPLSWYLALHPNTVARVIPTRPPPPADAPPRFAAPPASAAPRAPPDPACGCGSRAGSIHAEIAWSSRVTDEREQPEHPPAGKGSVRCRNSGVERSPRWLSRSAWHLPGA